VAHEEWPTAFPPVFCATDYGGIEPDQRFASFLCSGFWLRLSFAAVVHSGDSFSPYGSADSLSMPVDALGADDARRQSTALPLGYATVLAQASARPVVLAPIVDEWIGYAKAVVKA
jgi:hypothetical protein